MGYFALLLIAEGDGSRPSDLAATLCLDGSSLTGHLDRLVDQGLAQRQPDPDDRRVIRAVATDAGRALLATLEPLGEVLRDLEPDLTGRRGDAGSEAERALAEVQEAVRQVSAAFERVDRAATASVDALGALAQRNAVVRTAKPRVLRVATMTAARAGGGATLMRFADLVHERSGGAIRVECDVPYREAGGELQLLIDVRAGRLALIGVTAAVAGNLVPAAQALELPYLFDSHEHARRVLDGPLHRELLAAIGAHGLLGLGIASNGLRSLTTADVPVHGPDDVRGLRLRTQQAPVNVYFAESLGAVAVPIPYERLDDALRDGDVDAQENALPNIADLALWRHQRHLTLTEHSTSCLVLLGNPSIFAALGPDRTLVEDALRDAIADGARFGAALDRDARAVLAQHMNVIDLTHDARAAFADATRRTRERMARALGDDVLARVLRAVEAARYAAASPRPVAP